MNTQERPITMDYTEQIQLIRSQTLVLLQDVTQNPKPSYTLDGQSVSWESYLKQLQSTLDWCNAQLDEPFEIRTQAGT